MKKIFSAVLLAMVFAVVVSASVLAYDGGSKVTKTELPSDSKIVGSYSATFCNLGMCWGDQGTYKSWELILDTPCVHVDYLDHVDLAAKPGYTWVWKDGNILRRSGYFLVKNKK